MSIFDGPITLEPAADFHVHLRDGEMSELVTPTIQQGGVDTVYVMPNLVPPVTTVASALSYRSRLESIDPFPTYLMTLYLHPSITPDVISQAAQAGVSGVKVYPAGVTTNSASGVVSLEPFHPVFAAMQERDMVLNLHGEVPSTPPSSAAYAESSSASKAATVLTAEPLFLPTLAELARAFPRLRIVLEHCTTAAAVAAVRACGGNVRGTITAHHLYLTTDDVVADSLNFCKPVAKAPADRVALLRAAFGEEDAFFFGSDSAPHPADSKRPGPDAESPAAAGCFTQANAVQLVVGAAEEAVARGWLKADQVTVDRLNEFLNRRGRKFYKVGGGRGQEAGKKSIVLEKKGERVERMLSSANGRVTVVPFKRGEEAWSLSWA